MINHLDVFYDRRSDKTYYADVVTPEVSILRPIEIQSLSNPLSQNGGCMISRRQSGLSDCKMVCSDLKKLTPVNDLGEPDYSNAPFIKIGILQGEQCKSFFENRPALDYARKLRAKIREEQAKQENQEQKNFDKEVSGRKVFEHPSGAKIIIGQVNLPAELFKNNNPTVAPSATNPSKKSSSGNAPKKKPVKKPKSKGRKPASNTEKLGPTGPTKPKK